MKKKPRADIIRQRTMICAAVKGGVNKSSISAGLAYEAARLGMSVLCVDCDGTGGFSSYLRAYAPEGHPSITDVIEGTSGLAVYPVEHWTPDPAVPWLSGGPAIPGGGIHILPAAPSSMGGQTVSGVVSQGGTTAEIRLAQALENDLVRETFDIILVDMPGTDNPAVLSTMLHAAEHVAFPFYPTFFAYETLAGIDAQIDQWVDATGKPINYLGGIPTSVPTNLDRSPSARSVLAASAHWLEEAGQGYVPVIAPGIERRTAVQRAESAALPVVQLAATKKGLRDVGTIPPALTRTLLTILTSMRPDPEDPDTHGRVDYDVEAMTKAVLSQDMPDEWRSIIDGPQRLPFDTWDAQDNEVQQ